MSICCIVPTNRPERLNEFKAAWAPLFTKHSVDLIVVYDGEAPLVDAEDIGGIYSVPDIIPATHRDLFCRYSDVVRNLGFVVAAQRRYDYVVTFDDDVHPPAGSDPLQEHLNALEKRVPLTWMNTAMGDSPYLRGVPYNIRDGHPVMLSHGVWYKTPDFDGETQLRLTNNGANPERLPYTLPYYVGPIPKHVYFALCGMSLMFRREALPYVYFAPMGPDSGYPDLHRFGDIWMGINLLREFSGRGWAVYTGASAVIHTRASDSHKNYEAERRGREWNEHVTLMSLYDEPERAAYFKSYTEKRQRYEDLLIETMKKADYHAGRS